jgi:RimJ/RimL family protein N-acetyltransferase
MEAVATENRRQTFLYGDVVYLRPLEKDDAKRSVSIRNTPYPLSPERTEAWLTDDGPGDHAIVRTADDTVVGSIAFEKRGYLRSDVTAWVAPAYGEAGLTWKAEALVLASDWICNEQETPSMRVAIPAAEQCVIDRLVGTGFVVTNRQREKKLVDGQWVDEIGLQRFNPGWLETLGDPMAIELPRTGTGIARPTPARPRAVTDPPKNAWMIGERVYLRPFLLPDIDESVLWNRRETDTFHMLGRQLPFGSKFAAEVRDDEAKEQLEYVFFSVCLRETDEFIGEVGLMVVDLVHRNAETASWFHRPDYRAQGYGSEAKQMLLEYAFDTLGLHMLESTVRFENTRSAAALRKQGYRESGRICWTSHRDGAFVNTVTFDLLAGEWRALASDTERPRP